MVALQQLGIEAERTSLDLRRQSVQVGCDLPGQAVAGLRGAESGSPA